MYHKILEMENQINDIYKKKRIRKLRNISLFVFGIFFIFALTYTGVKNIISIEESTEEYTSYYNIHDEISEGMYIGELISSKDVEIISGVETMYKYKDGKDYLGSFTYKDSSGVHTYELKYCNITVINDCDHIEKPKMACRVHLNSKYTSLRLYIPGECTEYESN